mgnify:CR=1 FL=1
MCCAECVSRRRFLTLAAGGSAIAAVITACGDGQVSGVALIVGGGGGGGGSRVTVVVGDYPGLASAGTLVQVTNTFIAVKRTGATSFVAFSMSCTHQGCLTSIVNGSRFDCPCHGSRFDVDGAVVNGPAASPLTTLPTAYDQATDTLTIN